MAKNTFVAEVTFKFMKASFFPLKIFNNKVTPGFSKLVG